MEDSWISPLNYKNLLKTNKKLKTGLWYSDEGLYSFDERDSNLNVSKPSNSKFNDSGDDSNLSNASSSISDDSLPLNPSTMKLNTNPSTSTNCDEYQNKVKINCNQNISNQ